ncbi:MULTISPECIES: hypothetical protein [unclassified Cupriavidus]|uniref:hypothetical protein n=1 Tax=Cupriavidus sp. H19C3 TaxID=3241603 RepID=UPI003BF8DB84
MPSSVTRADSSSRTDIPLQDMPSTSAQSPAQRGSASSNAANVPQGLTARNSTASSQSSTMRRRPVPQFTPSDAPATPPAQAMATTAPPQGGRAVLSRRDATIAALSSAAQQAIVSGASWGVARKTFQDLTPAVAGLIGAHAGGASGERYGEIVGAVIGNVLGGAALGATHYLVEHNAKRVRQAVGGAVAMAPTAADKEGSKQAMFVVTFGVYMAMKAFGSSFLPPQKNAMSDAAIAYAIDIAASTVGGFTAEALSNRYLAKGHSPVTAKWDGQDLRARVGGGVAAGGASMLADGLASVTQPNPDLFMAKEAMSSLLAGLGTMGALFTWFAARKSIKEFQSSEAPPTLSPDLEAGLAGYQTAVTDPDLIEIAQQARVASRPSSPHSAQAEV